MARFPHFSRRAARKTRPWVWETTLVNTRLKVGPNNKCQPGDSKCLSSLFISSGRVGHEILPVEAQKTKAETKAAPSEQQVTKNKKDTKTSSQQITTKCVGFEICVLEALEIV